MNTFFPKLVVMLCTLCSTTHSCNTVKSNKIMIHWIQVQRYLYELGKHECELSTFVCRHRKLCLFFHSFMFFFLVFFLLVRNLNLHQYTTPNHPGASEPMDPHIYTHTHTHEEWKQTIRQMTEANDWWHVSATMPQPIISLSLFFWFSTTTKQSMLSMDIACHRQTSTPFTLL